MRTILIFANESLCWIFSYALICNKIILSKASQTIPTYSRDITFILSSWRVLSTRKVIILVALKFPLVSHFIHLPRAYLMMSWANKQLHLLCITALLHSGNALLHSPILLVLHYINIILFFSWKCHLWVWFTFLKCSVSTAEYKIHPAQGKNIIPSQADPQNCFRINSIDSI